MRATPTIRIKPQLARDVQLGLQIAEEAALGVLLPPQPRVLLAVLPQRHARARRPPLIVPSRSSRQHREGHVSQQEIAVVREREELGLEDRHPPRSQQRSRLGYRV